ncbi:MAG: ribosome assembly factor SBDS [Thermoplasmata archaeon]|nr:ribosome assembly factor SBDS [Thermoplasmata archaeon]MBU1159102.1 ribosome assembly factor SBDS [Candidatus Thermoplasmatota archaeon]TFG69618.1 MAG: ribosome assembly factor SBDS [Methanomassiliicoccus sp.]
MVDLDEAIVARMESHGESFEILIDPDVVQKMKDGKEVDLLDHMAIDTIFKNAKKGTRASEDKIKEIFGTTDPMEVAKIIILKGEVQLTTEQRKVMQENKRKRVVEYIARNAMNPQTGGPHPPTRIETAMEEARIHIDPFKSVEAQVPAIMDALRPLIPIKFDKVRIAVKVSGEDYGRCYEEFRHFGKIVKEEWQTDGSWIGVVEMPAGLQTEFFEKINNKTHGEADVKVLKAGK